MANVDPLEIEKFSALAHRWWDPEGEFRPLHDINPLRLDYINRIVPLSGKIVLAARPHAALLPRVGSAAVGHPRCASAAAGRGEQVAHVPQVRWPRVCRRSRRGRGGAAVGC